MIVDRSSRQAAKRLGATGVKRLGTFYAKPTTGPLPDDEAAAKASRERQVSANLHLAGKK